MLRASLLALRKNPLRNHLHFYCMVTAQCFIFYVKERAARGAASAGGTSAATGVRLLHGFQGSHALLFYRGGVGIATFLFASLQGCNDANWGWFCVVAAVGRR